MRRLPLTNSNLPCRHPPSAATAQCAAVLVRKHARHEKCVRHGGRSFFEVTDKSLPRAFRPKARSHCAVAALGGWLGLGLGLAVGYAAGSCIRHFPRNRGHLAPQ